MAAPESFGPFRVLGQLGRGGMGTVYKVRDASGQIFALKVLSKQSRDLSHRFKREFRAASRLKHPNIVAVHDLYEGTEPYFTMEYVEGTDFLDYIKGDLRDEPMQRPEDFRKFFFGLGQILKAIDYVHAHGVVHRDLKPDNILVNHEGAIKITDFGLAKLAEADSFVTERGNVLGTVAYIAPEQINGQPVDGRTDLYAMGAVMYQALTGRIPFHGDESMAILFKKLSEAGPPSPRAFNPDLDRGWERITLKLMAREPVRRYQNVPELFADLRAHWEASSGKAKGDPFAQKKLLTEARGSLTAARFVGRKGELATLDGVLDRALAGAGQLVLVSGEPGVGKTRIVDELRLMARSRGVKIVAGRAPGSPTPYGHFLSVLERVAERMSGWRSSDVLKSNASDYGALKELAPRFAAVPAFRSVAAAPPLPPREARDRELRAVAALFRRLLTRSPMLLVLEDLHAADEASVSLLDHLFERFVHAPEEPAPLVVVVTYRDEEIGANLAAEAFTKRVAATRIALPRLGREEVAELVATMTGGDMPGDAVIDALYAETEGNPFFLEETVKGLVDAGALKRHGARWRIDEEAVKALAASGGRPLPEGVGHAVRERLKRIDPTTRAVLEAGAVAGRAFRAEVVMRASGFAEGQVLDGLAEALKAGLVIEPAHDHEPYRFHHERIREVVLADLSAEIRRALHAAVAQTLEGLREGSPEDLAYHFQRAGDERRALDHLPRAARDLAARFENLEALEAYEQALDLGRRLGAEAALMARLGLEAAEVAKLAGRLSVALEHARGAQRVAEASGLAVERAECLCAEAALLWVLSDYGDASRLAEEALQLAEAGGEPAIAARAHAVLGLVERRAGRLDEAESRFRAALTLNESLGLSHAVAEGLVNLAIVARKRDRHEDALKALDRALALYREAGDRRGMAFALSQVGSLHQARCEYDDAVARYGEAAALDREIGNRRGQAYDLASLGSTWLTVGDYDQAREHFEKALVIFRDLPDAQNEARALVNLGHASFRSDDRLGARTFYEAALEILDRLADKAGRSEALSALAVIEGRLGRGAQATAHALEAIELARAVGSAEKEAWACLSLARIGGDVKVARQAIAAAERAQDRNILFQAHHRLGMILAEGDQVAASREALARAEAVIEEIALSLGVGRVAFLNKPAVREVYAALGVPPPA